jgi:hypothetical protein
MSGLARCVLERRRRERKRRHVAERKRMAAVTVWCMLSDVSDAQRRADAVRPLREIPTRDARIRMAALVSLSGLARRPKRR